MSFRALSLLLASFGLCACELIADFDRGKLDAGRPPDAGATPEVPEDVPDAGPSEPDTGVKS